MFNLALSFLCPRTADCPMLQLPFDRYMLQDGKRGEGGRCKNGRSMRWGFDVLRAPARQRGIRTQRKREEEPDKPPNRPNQQHSTLLCRRNHCGKLLLDVLQYFSEKEEERGSLWIIWPSLPTQRGSYSTMQSPPLDNGYVTWRHAALLLIELGSVSVRRAQLGRWSHARTRSCGFVKNFNLKACSSGKPK